MPPGTPKQSKILKAYYIDKDIWIKEEMIFCKKMVRLCWICTTLTFLLPVLLSILLTFETTTSLTLLLGITISWTLVIGRDWLKYSRKLKKLRYEYSLRKLKE